jgi:hypothetical protein
VERLISDEAVSGGERAEDGGVGSERQTIEDASVTVSFVSCCCW